MYTVYWRTVTLLPSYSHFSDLGTTVSTGSKEDIFSLIEYDILNLNIVNKKYLKFILLTAQCLLTLYLFNTTDLSKYVWCKLIITNSLENIGWGKKS
jgi:hypothetical protein